MNIKKQDLLTALEAVKPGLGTKEIIEQAGSFVFTDGKVVTYNGNISISHPLPEFAEVEGAVKANEMHSLLGKIKKEDIEVSFGENEIQLKSGRVKAGFMFQKSIRLPLEKVEKSEKWKDLPEGFLKAMEFAMGACATGKNAEKLICVHVNKEGFVEGCDGYRICKVMLDGPMPVDTFLIPAPEVVTLLKLKPTKISKSEKWIHFKTDNGTIISCSIYYEDEYVDTSVMMKVKGTDITLPESTLEMIDKAMVFSKRDYVLEEEIEIFLTNGRFKVQSESDCGYFEEEVNIKYKGEYIHFSITPYLLRDILSETLTCTICEDRLKFSGDNWIYVTMLKDDSDENNKRSN